MNSTIIIVHTISISWTTNTRTATFTRCLINKINEANFATVTDSVENDSLESDMRESDPRKEVAIAQPANE